MRECELVVTPGTHSNLPEAALINYSTNTLSVS